MTSREFCYWLQGYFEIAGYDVQLDDDQIDVIKKHLNLVFKHEIDPSYGNQAYQSELSTIHNGPTRPETTLRC